MKERIRNATHLRRLVANHRVTVEFHGPGSALYQVRITTGEAEQLRRLVERDGNALMAERSFDGWLLLTLAAGAA